MSNLITQLEFMDRESNTSGGGIIPQKTIYREAADTIAQQAAENEALAELNVELQKALSGEKTLVKFYKAAWVDAGMPIIEPEGNK